MQIVGTVVAYRFVGGVMYLYFGGVSRLGSEEYSYRGRVGVVVLLMLMCYCCLLTVILYHIMKRT